MKYMARESLSLCNVSSITQGRSAFMPEFKASLSPAGPISGPQWGEH